MKAASAAGLLTLLLPLRPPSLLLSAAKRAPLPSFAIRPEDGLLAPRFGVVWSGRELQEGFVDLADVRSCINVFGF